MYHGWLVLFGCLIMSASCSFKISQSVQTALESQQESGMLNVWVYFENKPSLELVRRDSEGLTTLFTSIQSSLSPKTIWRRSKVRDKNTVIQESDVPVEPIYINAILATSEKIKLRTASKWLNAISIQIPLSLIETIASLDFVKHIELIARYSKKIEFETDFQTRETQSSNYLAQLQQLNIIPVHESGNHGQNITILVIDSGFSLHSTIDSSRILATFDFIHNITDVDNQPDENPDQHEHGTAVLSVIAAYKEDTLIGSAYEASFLLAKTEIVDSETIVEEDYFAAAVEWGESMGADIVTASLGYNSWYTYEQIDGNTAICTRIINKAVQEYGMVATVAAGNYGSEGIIPPSDSPYAISVGAVTISNTTADFSSYGNTYNGISKPDVVAKGVNVFCANAEYYTQVKQLSGTSLACPLVAGVVALILSAHPDYTPDQVRQALFTTAKDSTEPSYDQGYGVVNALQAVVVETQVCPDDCGNGVCSDSKCVCNPNYYGFDCGRMKVLCTSNCNHGYCDVDKCVCHELWEGPVCNYLSVGSVLNLQPILLIFVALLLCI